MRQPLTDVMVPVRRWSVGPFPASVSLIRMLAAMRTVDMASTAGVLAAARVAMMPSGRAPCPGVQRHWEAVVLWSIAG